MKVIVYPHSMEVGGSQKNAVDLASELRSRGHEVLVFSPPGPLVDVVRERGLRHELAPRPRIRPSNAIMGRLCAVASEMGADIVHGFEWPPAVEAAFGPYRRLNIPVVCTIMSMSVAPFLPPFLPVTVGTQQLLASEQKRRLHVSLLEPPVDTVADRPVDAAQSRRALGVDDGTIVVSLVTRLATELKLEGILSAIHAAEIVAADAPIRLLIAGDGPSRAEVKAAADRVNTTTGRLTVQLLGNVDDPRPIYDAADIALGMGGSALRSMAFAKPLVVQGERGFWRLLETSSLPEFTENGWFGIGDGENGADRLASILRPLIADRGRRELLGLFSREVVLDRYDLEAATNRLEALYLETIERQRAQSTAPLLRPYLSVTRYEMDRKVRRRFGGVSSDDFNSVAAMAAMNQGRAST
ncbi:MAG: hypothetical protein QOD05_2116 [Microbacteriaceae bacterium]|nr:hypothetical protein [Microbacteriaceae bacterium]